VKLVGLLILGDRVGGARFATQDLDMLRCIADHAAASLVSIRLSERLLQSRELEAFQTMAAFFVHDLKNAASTLNLMLPNLPVHWDNPEFREDTLRGITKTVGHINALIRRLSELRNELKLQPRPTDLVALLERVAGGWKSVPEVHFETALEPVPVANVDADQILTVVTNLVLNARDAIIEGRVRPGNVKTRAGKAGGLDRGHGYGQRLRHESGLFIPVPLQAVPDDQEERARDRYVSEQDDRGSARRTHGRNE
jgi:signal transduction histidine kinase